MGPTHRLLFHDLDPAGPLFAGAFAQKFYPNDPAAKEAAYNHILVDRFCSDNQAFKSQLELMAELDNVKKDQKQHKAKLPKPKKKNLKKRKRKIKQKNSYTIRIRLPVQ